MPSFDLFLSVGVFSTTYFDHCYNKIIGEHGNVVDTSHSLLIVSLEIYRKKKCFNGLNNILERYMEFYESGKIMCFVVAWL